MLRISSQKLLYSATMVALAAASAAAFQNCAGNTAYFAGAAAAPGLEKSLDQRDPITVVALGQPPDQSDPRGDESVSDDGAITQPTPNELNSQTPTTQTPDSPTPIASATPLSAASPSPAPTGLSRDPVVWCVGARSARLARLSRCEESALIVGTKMWRQPSGMDCVWNVVECGSDGGGRYRIQCGNDVTIEQNFLGCGFVPVSESIKGVDLCPAGQTECAWGAPWPGASPSATALPIPALPAEAAHEHPDKSEKNCAGKSASKGDVYATDCR